MSESGTRGKILKRLQQQYGELVPPRALWRELGYRSASGARTARQRGLLPVATFCIDGRKGFYARSTDVADWLETVGSGA